MNNSNNSTNEEKTHSTVRQKGYMPESQDKSLKLTEAGCRRIATLQAKDWLAGRQAEHCKIEIYMCEQ